MNSRGRESSRPPTIVTAATEKEARRVLEWQEEVARSTAGSSTGPTSDEAYRAVAPSHVSRPPARTQISHAPQSQSLDHPPFRRAETFPRVMRRDNYAGHGHPGTQLSVRREMSRDEEQTVYVDEVERQDQEKEKEKSGGLFGMTNKALVGTFLGAAAGAAFAYAMVKSEDPEYELEPEKPRASLRRSYTTGHAETIASSSRGGSSVGPSDHRYRVIEAPMPPPASNYSRIQRDRERGREGVLSPIEERSYYSAVAPSTNGAKIRRRSTAEHGEGSNAGTAKPPTAINMRDKPQTIAASRVSERTSTVKAMSRAPSQVSRASPPRDTAKTQVSIRESEYEYGNGDAHAHARYGAVEGQRDREREDLKSRVSHTHTTIKFSPAKNARAPSHVSERERERIPRSEATWERDDETTVSAREVPLPASTVVSARYGGGYREQGSGYTHAGRGGMVNDRAVDEDGKSYFCPKGAGAMSVAPSDSVSSVGSKRERIERLRGRLERDLRA